MREWLTLFTEHAVLWIDAAALVVIVLATAQVVVAIVRIVIVRPTNKERREIWMTYARWLIAGLTLQLAADILETAITTDLEAIVRVAAIAVIRTMLNYFLEKDLDDVREREERSP
jgi:uncharacterized membrane protein